VNFDTDLETQFDTAAELGVDFMTPKERADDEKSFHSKLSLDFKSGEFKLKTSRQSALKAKLFDERVLSDDELRRKRHFRNGAWADELTSVDDNRVKLWQKQQTAYAKKLREGLTKSEKAARKKSAFCLSCSCF